MNYIQKYYDELFMKHLTTAYEEGLISHDGQFLNYIKNRQDISNFYVMNLAVLSDRFEETYQDMTTVYNSSKIDYATNYDLDDIGSIVGCSRPQATKASVEMTFMFSQTDEVTRVIPEGVIVSTNGGTEYATVREAVLPVGANELTVEALAVKAGSDSRVFAYSLDRIESNLDDVEMGVTCINHDSSYGGYDAMGDDEYRELIKNWVKNNTKGSKEVYERYFANFDGINSYKLIPNWDGSGTLKIVLDPGSPDLLNQAYNEITESVCQFTEDITMFAPEEVEVDIHAICNVDIDQINPYSDVEKDEIRTRIVDAIGTYIDGDVVKYAGLGIGEDFIPYQLGIFIHELVPELKNIRFEDDSPVTITDEQKCKLNSINVEME